MRWPLLAFLLTTSGLAGILGPGKYTGTVIFDRWGACHLYSGVYVMEISEKIKDSLRVYDGRAITVDAQDVLQPMNPGDALIMKLEVLGPAAEQTAPQFGRPPVIEGLALDVTPSFPAIGPNELVIQLRNEGRISRRVDTNDLAPTLFSKQQGLECFVPSDGPSYAAFTRFSISLMSQTPAGGSCLVNGKGRTIKLALAPGFAISQHLEIQPGQSIEVPLRFELSAGEYEFLAGYGGGSYAARGLASNPVSFDVDDNGSARLIGSSAALNHVRASQPLGPVCGRVTMEDDTPAVKAQVLLWPYPASDTEPRAANMAFTDSQGLFRMEAVGVGRYALTAQADHGGPVLSGAVGYEVGAVVQANGRYEFRNVPPGYYNLQGGWTGTGFEVTGDKELRVDFRWPPPTNESPAAAEPDRESEELFAVVALRQLYFVQQQYSDSYKAGFAPDRAADCKRPRMERLGVRLRLNSKGY